MDGHTPSHLTLAGPRELHVGLFRAYRGRRGRWVRHSRRRDLHPLAHVQDNLETLSLSASIHLVPGFTRLLQGHHGPTRALSRGRDLQDRDTK